MVHKLGHVCDQFDQSEKKNIVVRDLQNQGGFASVSHKEPRCGVNNVNKFIGNIAKKYMETTEGENWASDLINHLNSRYPLPTAAVKGLPNFNQQDANLVDIVSYGFASSHSSLPGLVPPFFCNLSSSCPQNYMNFGYNSASENIYNRGLCGGSAFKDCSQNFASTSVSCGGMNLISQSATKQNDLELITSPEQVSSITACSYGDVISDTEAFDSRAARPGSLLHATSGKSAENAFKQLPFHKGPLVGQYRSSVGKKRTAYNMDFPSFPVDDVQPPIQMPMPQQLNQWAHRPPVQSESSSHISSYQILISYVMYKDMPAHLRLGISFRHYMHATACTDKLCNCPRYLQLASHFDECNDLNCNVCGPARSSCSTGDLHEESRKRKKDVPDASGHEGCTGTLMDALPKKCLKTGSSTVEDQSSREHAMADDQKKNLNDARGEQEPIGLKSNYEIKKLPTKPMMPSVPSESEKIEMQIASSGDQVARLEPEKIKIQSVSLADFFTAAQIKQHLLSFTAPKTQDVSVNTTHSVGQNTCQLCKMDKLVFAPAPIYCSSCDIRIKRNVGYYRSANDTGIRHCFCMSCHRGSHGTNIIMRGFSIPKASLQKAKNDEEKEDSWVLCDRCQCWQHRICGLYNDERDVEGKAEYVCPKCYLEEIESGVRVPLPQTAAFSAKDLPRTNLSDYIEERLSRRLKQEREEMAKVSGVEPEEVPGAEDLVVRVVVSVEKRMQVKQQFISILHGEDYPSEFVYRSKLIFLLQKIEGVDVCLFGMCVQEFGSGCRGPNHRCVYISYLDSIKYFRPERKSITGESLRTFVYHEILLGYLEYCKTRGFATCYIWACPLIKGEDYIFYCHPETQKTPKQDKLRQWYKSMLKKAAEENVVVDHTNLYNQFFVASGQVNGKITAARLPYFDGDYWSGAAENIVRKLEVEENAGGLQSKLPNRRTLKAMGQDKLDVAIKDVLVMQKLGQTILPVKENFMIVHLQHICTHCHEVILSGSKWFCNQCKKFQLCSRCLEADKHLSGSKMHTCHSGEKNQLSEVEVNDVTLDTKDPDDMLLNSFFETRDAFLNKCQKSHFQFDSLAHAKYSSMMILYHLIHKPAVKPTCASCHDDILVDRCWHCDICTKYYICEPCYKMSGGTYHLHKLNPPSTEVVSEEVRKQEPITLKVVLDALIHASQCTKIPCPFSECRTIRRLFYHARRCSVKVRGGCMLCHRVWRMLKEHSQVCGDPVCKIPRCMDIKQYKETLAAARALNTVKDQQEVRQLAVG